MVLTRWFIFIVTFNLVAALTSCTCDDKMKSAASAEKKTLHIGINAEYPPFSFYQDNKIVGFEIDLIQEIAKELGVETKVNDFPFEALLPQLEQKQLDFCIAAITPTPERAKKVLFSDLYLSGDPLVIVSTKNTVLSLETMSEKGELIVVNEGYTADLFLTDAIKKGQYANLKVTKLPIISDGFLSIKTGRAEGFLTSKITWEDFKRQQNGHQETFFAHEVPQTEETYAMAFAKDNTELQKTINAIIKKLKENGTILQLSKKWKLS